MAIELEDNVKVEDELKTLEAYTQEEALKEKQEEEKSTPIASLGSEFDFFINFFHQLTINKIFKLNFDNRIILELDSNLKKLLRKDFQMQQML